MNAADFIRHLESCGLSPRRSGAGWQARCASHDDHNASLSIAEGKDGRILLRCHAGCAVESIVGALGLKLADLFPPGPTDNSMKERRIVASYDYHDEAGKLLFQCVRFEPKDFRQRRPDPIKPGEWVWNLKDTRRVLYRLPEVKAALTDGRTIFVAEGEKDCDALVKHGFAATCNPMGAGKWLPEHTETLRGAARVVVVADKDTPGRNHAHAVAGTLHGVAKSVKLIEMPDLNGKPIKDTADWFAAGGTAEALDVLVKSAPEYSPKSEAPTGKPGKKLQGRAVNLPDVEPWPEPVNGAEVLNEAAESFGRYIVLPDGAADVLALWCAHVHAFNAFLCSPRLNISSPERGCGKTTLRDVVAGLVPRPLPTENLSVAVLFRLVETHTPTILADEYDAWLRDKEELRGLLNAGHRRGGIVYRCEGDNHEVRGFQVFAPAVLCGIGALPGTLHDRSIVIRLERAKPGELSERFDSRRVDREAGLCRKLARWCADNSDRLESSDPALPSGAFNRLADNWRPLFVVAEIAGGDWPQRAASAFGKLTSQGDAETQGDGVALLSDVQAVFNETGSDRIWTEVLCEHLNGMPERPYADMRKGQGINAHRLGKQLGRFKIGSRKIRLPGEPKPKQGYCRTDFQEAFDRYLSPEGDSKWNTGTMPENIGDSHVSKVEQPETVFHFQSPEKLNGHAGCSDVPLATPGESEKELSEAMLL
jgi:hypothetical protein